MFSIANGVVVCDNYDNIILVNTAATKILNTSESEILNTSIQKYCDAAGDLCFKDKIAIFKNTLLAIQSLAL